MDDTDDHVTAGLVEGRGGVAAREIVGVLSQAGCVIDDPCRSRAASAAGADVP